MSRRGRSKYVVNQVSNDIFVVNLAVNQAPTYKVNTSKGIVMWGDKNDHPDYLLFLYNNSSVHGSIVNGKSRYISGLSIRPKEQNELAEQWLSRANEFETMHEYLKKRILDKLISGNTYTLVQPNIIGVPLVYTHLDFAKCRISDCGEYVLYSDDWKSYRIQPIPFPIWYEGIKEPAIMVEKSYSPTATKLESFYGRPEYQNCILDIDTDCEIKTFFNSLVRNNFSAGTIVTLFTGKIKPEEKEDIRNRILREHSGSERAGSTVLSFANEGAKGAEVANLNSNDLDKQYQEVAKRNREDIMIGHGVPPVLFKQITPGALGQRNELLMAYEVFMNEYVYKEQQIYLNWLTYQYKLRTGQEIEFEFEQEPMLGLDFTDPNISKFLTVNEVRERLGLSPTTEISGGLETTKEQAAELEKESTVNENLKNLSGRQFQGLMRIVKKYDDEIITKEQALLLMVNGFGITEEEANKFLGIADEDEDVELASVKNKVFFNLVKKYSHEINPEDEILEEVRVNGHHVHFSEVASLVDIRNEVLQQLKGNPNLNEKDLIKITGYSKEQVEKTLNWLRDKKLISGLTPTSKSLGKEYKTEIITEYTYGLREDKKGEKILLSTSRDFCVDMVSLTKTRALSYDAINNLSNEFGENAWDFRGGFYTDGKTKQTTPWCRHVWVAQTKLRRVK